MAKVPPLRRTGTGTGTCYQDAMRYLMANNEGTLIHGTVQRATAEGIKRIRHAWIELLSGEVWEPETKQVFTKEQFSITKPQEEARYTVTEASVMMLKHSHFGPWHEEILPENAAIRTDKRWDAMVKHLGYTSVTAPWGSKDSSGRIIKKDIELIAESQERLRDVEVINERNLSPAAKTHLLLARQIADDAARYRKVRGVHAAIIPPASDRVRTAGMYARTEEIFISGEMLERAKNTVDTTIHELAHHTTGAGDAEEAHNAEVSRIGGLVVASVANENYDDIIRKPDFQW